MNDMLFKKYASSLSVVGPDSNLINTYKSVKETTGIRDAA